MVRFWRDPISGPRRETYLGSAKRRGSQVYLSSIALTSPFTGDATDYETRWSYVYEAYSSEGPRGALATSGVAS
jgi:hypothetical protein